MAEDGMHSMLKGREFLGVVAFAGSVSNIIPYDDGNDKVGANALGGPYLLTAEAIGGRIKLLAQDFEEFRFKRLRFTYVPVVAATEPGAIALAFNTDIAVNGYLAGIANIAHMSSGTFVSGNVFEELSLDVKPQDVLKRYFDSTTGDFSFETQGKLNVLSVGGLAIPVTTSKVFGDLYLEYEIDYFSPRLDTEIALIPTGTIGVSFGATTAVTEDYPVIFADFAGAKPIVTWAQPLPDDPGTYMLCLTVATRTTSGTLADPFWKISGETAHHFFYPGFTFYARVHVVTSTTNFLALFTNPDAASAATYVTGSGWAIGEGSVLWAQTIAATGVDVSTYQFSYRAIKLEDD
jgi:hypothetical protein